MNTYQTPEGRDPRLWEMARKRASFKKHLSAYIVVNGFLWLLWLITGARISDGGIPWPAWSTLGWGIGLAFNYLGAYVMPWNSSIDKEYDKLIQKNQY